MSQATCAVLSAIFPLVLATGVLERRDPHIKIRRHRFFRRVFLGTFGAALCGTVYAVIGVQFGGFTPVAAIVMWILFGAAVCGLAVTLLASVATAEIQEDSRGKKGRKQEAA